MRQIQQPMLAGRATTDTLRTMRYPVLVTPKLDGIRCLMVNGKAVSRTFKPIKNKYTRDWLEAHVPNGVDGELVLQGKHTFQEITSAVMSEEGQPQFKYVAFDYVKDGKRRPYHKRMDDLFELGHGIASPFFSMLLPDEVHNEDELLRYEQSCLNRGHEGVMIRTPNGPYKEGRSTEREGYLLKLKRFHDGEAKVISVEELMHNENDEEQDAFGRTKRSTKAAGKRPAGMLGALVVQDLKTKECFKIGTGFDEKMRRILWAHKKDVLGKIAKYKYQEVGTDKKPRFPVFLGFRDKTDM